MIDDQIRKLVIIPAYDEEENIVGVVSEIEEKAPDFDYIVINDCSKDDTLKLCRDNGINVVDLPINLGIGGAVQTGYKYAYLNNYDYAVQLDGDGQHDPKYLSAMFETIVAENADMIIGSRFIEKKGFQSSATRRLGIKYFTFLIRTLTGTIITDPTSGFRMVNSKTMESVVSVLKTHSKVIEMPVKMRERRGGVSSINIKNSVYYMVKVTIAIIMERIRK